jgi:hypothetical protein
VGRLVAECHVQPDRNPSMLQFARPEPAEAPHLPMDGR